MTAMIWSTRAPDSGAMSLAMAYRELFRGLLRAVKGKGGSALLPTVFHPPGVVRLSTPEEEAVLGR